MSFENSAAATQLPMFTGTSEVFRHGGELNIEPLDATFKDSSKTPLHSWFPYLEGYSPKFVERVRQEYLPGATRIIEPFAGSGTTPIALAQAGIECAFSEANPAMAFIATTKLSALHQSPRQSATLKNKLNKLADTLRERALKTATDEGLQKSYIATFGESIFFDEESKNAILRLRTINDEILDNDPRLGNYFAVAVLSSLIPASRLKRAGDLRYKTEKELASPLPHPYDLVETRLRAQANDLLNSAHLNANATFICPTAGALHEHLDNKWDGVITSPPYLNGTNYIRNARLELWYLRYLNSNSDLRQLRDSVITSGINDVHSQTKWKPTTKGVENVVHDLQKNAYDARIAKMVGGYFNDMSDVFYSLGKCLRPQGRLCIDIGDSIYNGIHVATDDLLVEIAENLGYITIERVHLRKRISKCGAAVRQQLLVFERPTNFS